jgi:hypothetical protein
LRNEVRNLSDPSGAPLVKNRTTGAGRRAAEQRDERVALHSITSSARNSSVGEIVIWSALALLRLLGRV